MSRCGRSTFSSLETRLRSRRRNRPRCMPRVRLLLMPITDTRSPPFSSSYSLLQTSLKSIFRSTSSAFLLPFTSLGASGRSSSLKTEAWSRCCPPHAPGTPYPPLPSPPLTNLSTRHLAAEFLIRLSHICDGVCDAGPTRGGLSTRHTDLCCWMPPDHQACSCWNCNDGNDSNSRGNGEGSNEWGGRSGE